LGMVDVRRDDGAPGGDFASHELRRDFVRDSLRETAEDGGGEFGSRSVECGMLRAAGVLLLEVVAGDVSAEFFNPQSAFRIPALLPDGDEFHLRRDDPLPRIPKLRHRMPRAGAQRTAALALQAGKLHETISLGLACVLGVVAGEGTVVLQVYFAPVR